MVVQNLSEHQYELLSPHVGSEKPILVRHECGTERWVPLATLQAAWYHGTPGCPTCKSKKASDAIILKTNTHPVNGLKKKL